MPRYDFFDRKFQEKYNHCKDMIEQSNFFVRMGDEEALKKDFNNLSKDNFLNKYPSYSETEYDNTREASDYMELAWRYGSNKFHITPEAFEKIKQGGRIDSNEFGVTPMNYLKAKRISMRDLYKADETNRLYPKRRDFK